MDAGESVADGLLAKLVDGVEQRDAALRQRLLGLRVLALEEGGAESIEDNGDGDGGEAEEAVLCGDAGAHDDDGEDKEDGAEAVDDDGGWGAPPAARAGGRCGDGQENDGG